jgi:ribosomal protein S18 acetylase RimI-like enzyme
MFTKASSPRPQFDGHFTETSSAAPEEEREKARGQWRVKIVPSTAEDRPRIREILLASGLFKESDADCVDEMFGLALARPTPDNYRFLSAWLDDQMAGFACYGWESLTHGTWDLFWIVTLPNARRRGLGGALLRKAVRIATAEGGRLMVIYTSSTPPYAAGRKLYESENFVRTAILPDYYNVGDDLHIYSRRLQEAVLKSNR